MRDRRAIEDLKKAIECLQRARLVRPALQSKNRQDQEIMRTCGTAVLYHCEKTSY